MQPDIRMKMAEAWKKYGPFRPIPRQYLDGLDQQRVLTITFAEYDDIDDLTEAEEEELITGLVGVHCVNADGFYLSKRQMPANLVVVDIGFGEPPCFPGVE